MSRRRNRVFGWSLALAAMAAFSALGTWQLERMRAKAAMLSDVEQTLSTRDPRPLALAAQQARRDRYDWAAGTGRFLASPPVLLDNQQRNGRAGVLAYRAFAPEEGPALLVELGWLPLDGARTLPRVPQPLGRMRIRGLLVPPPSPGLATPVVATRDEGLLATALDADLLAAPLDLPALPPRVLKLDPTLPIGYARDLDILPNTLPPERHLGYAVQWYALALAVLVTALVLTLRKPRA